VDGVYSAGTIFHDILVWFLTFRLPEATVTMEVTPLCISTARPRTACISNLVYPLYKLSGHRGSVLQLRWACGARVLISGADDRTARVWRLPKCWWQDVECPSGHCCSREQESGCGKDAIAVAPVFDLWGHGARVWDVISVGRCDYLCLPRI
jgi:WD40 repeat protein